MSRVSSQLDPFLLPFEKHKAKIWIYFINIWSGFANIYEK